VDAALTRDEVVGSMTTSRHLLRNRKVSFMARDLLRERGYATVQSMVSGCPVDLVAWRDDRSLLFVRTARSRRRFSGVTDLSIRFYHEIAILRRIPKLPYLAIEFWVYFDDGGWRFFTVYRNGLAEVVG
jgi:hypothetical protein